MRSIDIHAHIMPQCFYRATADGGDWHGFKREVNAKGREAAVLGERRVSTWTKAKMTPEQRLAEMDSLGVDVHVLTTIVGLYNYNLDLEITRATSQDCNDELSQAAKSWPDRFAGLGSLPMQDVKAAINELDRCVNKLGLKGAIIGDHVNGRTYDEPEFLPFFKAAEQMGAVIFFHQGGNDLVPRRIGRYHLPNTIGNPVNRVLTFATLVFGGVMDACPDVKIVFGHGGGFTCFGIGRMDRGWQVRSEARVNITQPPSTYLRRFYYDSVTHSEASLRFLIDTVGADRVVFGTDWPADMALDWPVSWIMAMESLTQEEKELILYKNLEQLLGI